MRGHPIFATIYDHALRKGEANFLSPMRRRLLEDLSGRVLDLGAGTGANLPFFPDGVEVFALEPDPYMRKRGQKRAPGSNVTWVDAPAESIPFATGYFDAVVATLVLCTVKDPQNALAEIHRVLRPGGTLVFLEHVASHNTVGYRLQTVINPVWRLVAAGCHLNRATMTTIEVAGFVVQWQDTRALPLVPFVWGQALRV